LAKKTDHRADGLGTDNTGGVLSGLLAEEDELDRRALWRLGSWGVGAVAAVVVAVMANQTQLGWKRDQMAAADLGQRAQQMQNIANQTEREARRLAAAIDTLNSDRDRLYTRVTSLEHGLDSVTGSIARQNSAAASPAQPAPAAEPQAAQHPAPAVAPVTTQTAAAAPDKPAPNPAASEPGPTVVSSAAKDPLKDSARETAKTDVPKSEGKKSETAKSGTGKSEAAKSEAAKVEAGKVEAARIEAAATAKTDSAKTEATKTEATKADAGKAEVPSPATPLVASKSFMAPPDPSASKLIEPAAPLTSSPVTASPIPEVMAAAPATDAEADEETGPKVAIQRTQFGVDVGTANSVPGLRALWRGLLKSRSNASLAGLRPIIVIKESTNGLGMQLRLVAGPLNDAGAAAKICAVLIENKRSCETAIFDGQRLSMTGDDPAPAARAKPSSRHRSVAKRAVVAEEAPKKPEPVTPTTPISSWFGKRGQ